MTNPYFDPGLTWGDRLAGALAGASNFAQANSQMINKWLVEHGARVVINAGADALLALLDGAHYLNKYELFVLGGTPRAASARRVQVDTMLGFADPSEWYFGAVAIGGAGVRFYGEYCLVLRETHREPLQLLDRNSFDLTDPPLDVLVGVVQALRGTWAELHEMITLKTLPQMSNQERLVTVGTIAEAVLHDEDFIEVHMQRPGAVGKRGFQIDAIAEVRQAPEEIAQEEHLERRFTRCRLPTGSELLWSARRTSVDRQLDQASLPSRVVTTDGRGARWR